MLARDCLICSVNVIETFQFVVFLKKDDWIFLVFSEPGRPLDT